MAIDLALQGLYLHRIIIGEQVFELPTSKAVAGDNLSIKFPSNHGTTGSPFYFSGGTNMVRIKMRQDKGPEIRRFARLPFKVSKYSPGAARITTIYKMDGIIIHDRGDISE